MRVRDILFDLGKVLVPFDWGIALSRLEPYLSEELALLCKADRHAFEALFHDRAMDLEMGRIDFTQSLEIANI